MFKDFFKTKKESYFTVSKQINEKIDPDEKIKNIRKKGIKIKTIVPTKFGFQVDFFNANDAKQAAEIADTNKIAGNSIMVESELSGEIKKSEQNDNRKDQQRKELDNIKQDADKAADDKEKQDAETPNEPKKEKPQEPEMPEPGQDQEQEPQEPQEPEQNQEKEPEPEQPKEPKKKPVEEGFRKWIRG